MPAIPDSQSVMRQGVVRDFPHSVRETVAHVHAALGRGAVVVLFNLFCASRNPVAYCVHDGLAQRRIAKFAASGDVFGAVNEYAAQTSRTIQGAPECCELSGSGILKQMELPIPENLAEPPNTRVGDLGTPIA